MSADLTTVLAAMRLPPVPGRPEKERAKPFEVATVVRLSAPGSRLGPAHECFDARFGAPARRDALDMISSAPAVPPSVLKAAARASAPRPAQPARPQQAEIAASLEKSLRRGGLWREADLAAEAGVSVDTVRHALRGLQDDGKALMVALGQWRSRYRSVDLASEGKTLAARLLGLHLVGLAIPVAEAAEHLGVTEREAREEAESLRRQGHLAPAGATSYRCPLEVRERVVPAMGPEPLSDLGARVVDALSCGRVMRKTDLADEVGIGRGSANRMVDRLVADGWLREAAPGAFAVA